MFGGICECAYIIAYGHSNIPQNRSFGRNKNSLYQFSIFSYFHLKVRTELYYKLNSEQ